MQREAYANTLEFSDAVDSPAQTAGTLATRTAHHRAADPAPLLPPVDLQEHAARQRPAHAQPEQHAAGMILQPGQPPFNRADGRYGPVAPGGMPPRSPLLPRHRTTVLQGNPQVRSAIACHAPSFNRQDY